MNDLNKINLLKQIHEVERENGALQNIHTPFSLCEQIVSKLGEFTDISTKEILVSFNVEFVMTLRQKYPNVDITFGTETNNKCRNLLAENYNIHMEYIDMNKNLPFKKQFDDEILNPPYQSNAGEKNSLWDKFIYQSFDLVKENGYICAIHPPGWRFPGSFSKLGTKLKQKQIEYLEMHDNKDGKKTFGVSTAYDWYILKNCPNYKKTVIKDRDGVISEIDIRNLPLIPNAKITKVLSLLAKEGEETVSILYNRTAYGTDKKWISKIKTETFKYPCAYSVNTKNELSLKWSSINTKDHFGIPKIILGKGCNFGIFEDKNGDYALTEWTFGIIEDPKNFKNIVKALSSKEFQEINKATTSKSTQGIGVVDKNIIKLFKKDFWREFV